MTDDARPLLDRIAAARVAREADLARARRAPVSAEARLGLPFAPGDRVFDTVSGEHGTVERAVPVSTDGAALVSLRTDSGALYVRNAAKLIERPSER